MKTPQPIEPKQPEDYERELDIANETIEALQDQLCSEMLKSLTLQSKVDNLGLDPVRFSEAKTPKEADNWTPDGSDGDGSSSDASWTGK